MMRILILSKDAWDLNNSFGNSFTNMFKGIKDIEIANIYCNYGNPNNDFVSRHFQINEKTLLKNLLNSKIPSGKEVFERVNAESMNVNQKKTFNFMRKNRMIIFFWLRNIIWRIGRWKSKELKNFIDEFKPDVIFQPIFYSTYMNDIASFIKQYTKIPMIGLVSDELYTMKQFSLSPFFWIDRLIIRPKVKKIVDKCEFLYVISEVQKYEYEKCFNIPCKVITKGSDFSGNPSLKQSFNNPLKLVYTGNIGDGRWKSLSVIGQQLEIINKSVVQAQLFVYSMTPLTKNMKKSLNIENTMFFMGGVLSSEIPKIQSDADILVHVEATALSDKLRVRHSFSTKIVDYIKISRCIFAYGPRGIAPIEYFIDNKAGIVASNESEAFEKLSQIVDNPKVLNKYVEDAWESGQKNHDINKIQETIYNDMNNIVKVNKNENFTN